MVDAAGLLRRPAAADNGAMEAEPPKAEDAVTMSDNPYESPKPADLSPRRRMTLWDAYRRRSEYFEKYFANGPTWFVECYGKRVALLSDCERIEMFWQRYRVTPLTDDNEERRIILSGEFWDPDRAIRERYVFVNCDTGVPASNVLLGGRASYFAPFVHARGLYGPMKYAVRPWDRIALWVRRAFMGRPS